MHEVSVIGGFFEAPKEPKQVDPLAVLDLHLDPADEAPASEIIQASANVSGTFVLPSPFSTSELQELQSELKLKKLDYENRLRKLRDREQTLTEREVLVEERYSELKVLRTALQEFEAELSLRSEEVSRDEGARKAREKASWNTVAGLFEKGDPEDLIGKLLTYSPEEAAKIFSGLSVNRVRTLMEALPVEKYQDYVTAFRTMQTEETP